MVRSVGIALALVAVGPSCSGPAKQDDAASRSPMDAADAEADSQSAPLGWQLRSSGDGIALVLLANPKRPVVRLFCPAAKHRLLVNVPAFRPVGSEERMSFGSSGEVVALVADSGGDAERGGVSATGPVPDNLGALIGGPLSINYGSQDSGPHPAPPPQSARAFAAACSEAPPAEQPPRAPEGAPSGPAPAGACRMQDGRAIPPNLIRAIGTEPFWGARIEGRCVTYSHPEDQSGTRIWTQFTGTRDNGVWTGFYANRRFVLRTRPQPGCSDGMSDNRYPVAVSLTVAGEQRSGCAELL